MSIKQILKSDSVQPPTAMYSVFQNKITSGVQPQTEHERCNIGTNVKQNYEQNTSRYVTN